MTLNRSIVAALLASLLQSCAVAEPALDDRVTVDRQTITIEALKNAPMGDWDSREQGRLDRQAPVTDKRDALLSVFDDEVGGASLPLRFDIQPGFPQFSPWQVEGRFTKDGAVYVALPLNWSVRSEGREDVTFCTVRFDSADAVKFDHNAVLFLVLAAGNCSKGRLDDQELLAELTTPFVDPNPEAVPPQIGARAKQTFADGSEVEVLQADDFEWISDWRSVPAHYLGGEGYRQVLTQYDGAGTRGWLETSDGEELAFFQSREVKSAMCVYRGTSASLAFEASQVQMGFLRDTTPSFQRFCLDQLNAVDEENAERLRKDTRPIYTEPIKD